LVREYGNFVRGNAVKVKKTNYEKKEVPESEELYGELVSPQSDNFRVGPGGML
jgi:hypothetical protein